MKSIQRSIVLFNFIFLSYYLFAQIPNYVPSNGLQSWWPFSGNANDLGQNTFNGTINGATLTTDRFGSLNSAYSFSNETNITTSYAGIRGNNARSVSLWFQTGTPITGQGTELVLFQWGDFFQGKGFSIVMFAGNQLEIDINTSYVAYNVNTLGEWHHMVVTYSSLNGSNVLAIKMYLDGNLLTDISRTFNPTNQINTGFTDVPVRFGSSASPGQFFNGKLDDIGFWNRALTNQEIQDLFLQPTSVNANESSSARIQVYPNPLLSKCVIEGEFTSGDTFSITDALGKTYHSGNLSLGQNEISFENFSKGYYFLSIRKREKTFFKKIVKS